ncbi:MAG: IS3 family transposase [Alistipes finegoldii]
MLAKKSIIRLYHEHKGRYGYRRITVEMNKIDMR